MPAYKIGPMEPIAEVGENILVVDRESYRLYTVAFLEPISASHPFVANAVVAPAVILAAGAVAPVLSTTNILDMQNGQLGQFRMYVLDDIGVEFLQPQSLTRFGTLNQQARVNAFNRLKDPCDHLTEFFVFEQDRPFLRVTNPTQYALNQARVAFYGYKYVLSGADSADAVAPGGHVTPIATYPNIAAAKKANYKFTVAPVGGWGR